MSVVGRTDETMTSTMRLFFSSRTPRMMYAPYTKIEM